MKEKPDWHEQWPSRAEGILIALIVLFGGCALYLLLKIVGSLWGIEL